MPLLNSVSYVAQQCCRSRIRIYVFFKFRKGRVCSNPKCVKCTAKPCGKCRRCVNPASKNKCVNRYLTFTVFLVTFLQCCRSETKVSDPVSVWIRIQIQDSNPDSNPYLNPGFGSRSETGQKIFFCSKIFTKPYLQK